MLDRCRRAAWVRDLEGFVTKAAQAGQRAVPKRRTCRHGPSGNAALAPRPRPLLPLTCGMTEHVCWVCGVRPSTPAVVVRARRSGGKRLLSEVVVACCRLCLPAGRRSRPLGQPLAVHQDGMTGGGVCRGRPYLVTADLATANVDGAVRFWSPTTGRPIRTPLIGHANTVNAVAFSRDGGLVVTGAQDRTVRLWESHSGQRINHRQYEQATEQQKQRSIEHIHQAFTSGSGWHDGVLWPSAADCPRSRCSACNCSPRAMTAATRRSTSISLH
jgi:hypothetical protein